MILLSDLIARYPAEQQAAAAKRRLSDAYKQLFRGNGSREDAELVLLDLAYESGYFFVDDGSASDGQLRHDSGRRYLFGLIARQMNLAPQEIDELLAALSATKVLQGE